MTRFKIDTTLIETPDASHNIASRPSDLVAKAAYTLAWFERYRKGEDAVE